MSGDETAPERPPGPSPEDDDEPFTMRFTVIARTAGRVHLVSEGGGALFAHPAVGEDVWQAALTEVPPAWEIVDLDAVEDGAERPVTSSDPPSGPRRCRRPPAG